MNKNICEKCGSNLILDKKRKIRYCKYCGYQIGIEESKFDHEKYIAKINYKTEIQKQKQEDDSINQVLIITGIILFILLAFLYLIGKS